MAFHPQKCVAISTGTKRRKIKGNYTLHGHILDQVESSKYLGINISSDFKWNKHITSTASRANSTLGFIRRNLRGCTTDVKDQVYKSLVRPRLEYASSIWDPSTDQLSATLEKVQRRAARFVHNNYSDRTPGAVTSMLKDLKWDTLAHRRTINRLKIFYKIKNGEIDVDITQYLSPGDSRTRGKHKYHQQTCNKDTFKFSFFPRTAIQWNTLPTALTSAESTEEFSKRLEDCNPESFH